MRNTAEFHLPPYKVFSARHHARFIHPDVPIHVISRVFQGRHLLRPTAELNSIIVGVVGRALERYRDVRLYAMAFMSNHAHFMLQGPPQQVPAFIGFVKREISRRWGKNRRVRWSGTMWHEYLTAALPTTGSQEECLRYVLSQGVKEGLVSRPDDWPGVHCARTLRTGRPLRGAWLDATTYSRAADAQSRRRDPAPVHKARYLTGYEVRFARIPAWSHLDEKEYRSRVQQLVDEIVSQGKLAMRDRPPLGRHGIQRVPLSHRTELPRVPWLERRRRKVICWASPAEPAAIQFLRAYWQFQHGCRLSAMEDRERDRGYPPGAFAPGRWVPSLRSSSSPRPHSADP